MMNEKLLQAAKLLKQHCENQECKKCMFYNIREGDCKIGYTGYILPAGWEIESEDK